MDHQRPAGGERRPGRTGGRRASARRDRGSLEEVDELRRQQVERARYDADLARRRYLNVDPDNRLVADAMEADWNDRLRQITTLQQSHDVQREADAKTLDAEARERIADIARDFPRVWNDPRTAPVERKRMLALLIEDVTVVADRTHIAAGIRWRGGQTSSIRITRNLPIGMQRKTTPDVIAAIDQLLESYSDAQAAQRLNEMGYGNWRKGPRLRITRCAACAVRTSSAAATSAFAHEASSPPTNWQNSSACASPQSISGEARACFSAKNHGGHHCLYLPVDPRQLVKPAIGRPRVSAGLKLHDFSRSGHAELLRPCSSIASSSSDLLQVRRLDCIGSVVD